MIAHKITGLSANFLKLPVSTRFNRKSAVSGSTDESTTLLLISSIVIIFGQSSEFIGMGE